MTSLYRARETGSSAAQARVFSTRAPGHFAPYAYGTGHKEQVRGLSMFKEW